MPFSMIHPGAAGPAFVCLHRTGGAASTVRHSCMQFISQNRAWQDRLQTDLELPSVMLLLPWSATAASAPPTSSASALPLLGSLRPHERPLRRPFAALARALGAAPLSASSELCMAMIEVHWHTDPLSLFQQHYQPGFIAREIS